MSETLPAIPRAYPSTSLRWAVGSLVGVLALSVGVILAFQARIEAYEAGYAAATPGATATVVSSQHFSKGTDLVEVQWRGTDGVTHRHTFDVENAGDFPAGSAMPVRLSTTSPDQIYPESDRVIGPDDWQGGIALIIAGMVIATLVYAARAAWLWRAARGPARRYRAHLLYSYGKFAWIGAPWLSIEDNNRTWYQCVMWEPWVTTLNEQAVIEARRVGRGPFVIDVPGYGRLWPVGRARRREPLMQNLVRRHPNRYRLSRVTAVLFFAGLLFLPAALAIGGLGAVVAAGYIWLLVLYFGGGPVPVPFLRPKRYPRIAALRSSTPTDKPAPLPKPFPRRPRRRR